MFSIIQINQLEALAIDSAEFKAIILLQGAQLVEFSTTDHPNNWLFVSEANEFALGKPIRGGIPICWPVFGAFDKNSEAVKASFPEPLGQHGYARSEIWSLKSTETEQNSAIACFELNTNNKPHLSATVIFRFSSEGYSIELVTQNNEAHSISMSQALHSYFPTSDIDNTAVSGFDIVEYIDTLTANWESKTQQGDILFSGETDRIYQAGSNCDIKTPEAVFTLSADNSNSTVVWNPWIEKSKGLSQFNDEDYRKMLCVETANALDDAIMLAPKASHSLKLSCKRG